MWVFNESRKRRINPKTINALLNTNHVGAFLQAYQQAFGEFSFVGYNKPSTVKYTRKQDGELLKLLKSSSHFKTFYEQTEHVVRQIAPQDALSKDLAMVVLQPIGLAIEGSIQLLIGLVDVTSNIPAVLKKEKNTMPLAMSQLWLGVSIILLAAVAPLARIYHAATRAFASVVKEEPALLDSLDLDDDDWTTVYSALAENESVQEESKERPTPQDFSL